MKPTNHVWWMREQQEVTYKLLYSSFHLRRHFSNPFEKCSIIKRLQNPRECEWMRGEQPKQGIFIVNVIHLRKIFCNKTILVSFNGSINPILNLEDPYKTNLRFYQRKIKLVSSMVLIPLFTKNWLKAQIILLSLVQTFLIIFSR